MSKTAIVTGGSKRIGRSIALKLAELGYDIALHYNKSGKEALQTKKDIESEGARCRIFSYDLSDPRGIQGFTDQIFSEFEDVSLLVNNASVFRETRFGDVSLDDFYNEFNTNFISVFFLSQQFSKRVSDGMIINLIDARITKIHTLHFVYNLSKKLLGDFTLMAARSLGPGIRVNGICPGPIIPPSDKDDDYLDEIARKTPLKRTGSAEDIGKAVAYLVGNDFVTGEILFVDGGEHI